MKFIKEDDDERPSGHFANTYNIVVVPAGATAEEAAKAFEDKNNYGIYKSAMTDNQAKEDRYGPPGSRMRPFIERTFEDAQKEKTEEERIQKFIQANKNLKNPEEKYKTLRDNNGKFPLQTRADMENFLKSRTGKPNLVKFEIQGKTLVFPADKNPTKDTTVKIIKTVLDSAGIAYRLQEKETFTEAKLKAIIKEEIRKQLKK